MSFRGKKQTDLSPSPNSPYGVVCVIRELIRSRPRSTTDDMHLSMVMVSPGKNPTTPMARDTNPSTDDRQLGYDPPPPQPEEIDRRPSFVPPLKPQDKEPRLSYVPSPPKDKQDRRASYIPPPPPKDKEGRRGSYIPPPPPKDKGGRRTSYIPPPPPKDKGGRRASYVPPPPPKVKGIEGNRRFVQAPIDKHSSKVAQTCMRLNTALLYRCCRFVFELNMRLGLVVPNLRRKGGD